MIFKNNKTFDVLKWLTMIAIPAFATAYSQLANVLGWEYGSEVAEIAVIICTFLGTLLGISNMQYYKQNPRVNESIESYYDLDEIVVEEQSNEEGIG